MHLSARRYQLLTGSLLGDDIQIVPGSRRGPFSQSFPTTMPFHRVCCVPKQIRPYAVYSLALKISQILGSDCVGEELKCYDWLCNCWVPRRDPGGLFKCNAKQSYKQDVEWWIKNGLSNVFSTLSSLEHDKLQQRCASQIVLCNDSNTDLL